MRVALTHLRQGETVSIVKTQAVSVSGLTSLTIKAIYDIPALSKHQVYLDGFRDPVVLWEGSEYDAKNGSFTHSDIQRRIQDLAALGNLNITPDNGK